MNLIVTITVLAVVCLAADAADSDQEPGYILYKSLGCRHRNEEGVFEGQTRDECRSKCDVNANCIAFEWYGESNPHQTKGSGFCKLSSSCTYEMSLATTDSNDPDWLYVKDSPVIDFYGNGCCRYDDWKAENHDYKTKEECMSICAQKDECIAFDLARPRGDTYHCFTFYGSGNNFHTECGTSNTDELCFKKTGTTAYSYRVSNNGLTSWRPAVAEIRVFSDQSCSNELEATYVDESGHNQGFGDGSAAFDNNDSTAWRPQCHPCNANTAWVTFSTTTKAHCVMASNLGMGSGGGETWNVGIEVELQNEFNSWTTVMQSNSGNSAKIVTEETALNTRIAAAEALVTALTERISAAETTITDFNNKLKVGGTLDISLDTICTSLDTLSHPGTDCCYNRNNLKLICLPDAANTAGLIQKGGAGVCDLRTSGSLCE